MKWRLIYIDKAGHKPVAEFDIPHEGMEYGNKFVGVDLVWGMTPEGHRFAEIPLDDGSKLPYMTLMLRNPYYDYWKQHKPMSAER